MEVIRANVTHAEALAPLVAEFRSTLRSYRGECVPPDLPAALAEIGEYLSYGWPVFAAEECGRLIGYTVCRVDEPCLWVEQLFVLPGFRRRGAAGLLFDKAEELANNMGEDTVYNFIHPNNSGVIAFLRSRGYTVLNLVEVRKPYKGERLSSVIRVGENDFDY